MDKTSKDDGRKPVPFDQVVERLLGTPPKPHEVPSGGRKQKIAKAKTNRKARR